MHALTHCTRKMTVLCNASNSSFEKPKKIFTDFHKKRTETFKLNANDFVKVSQSEINDLRTFIKELDTFHRQQFDELKANIKKRVDKKVDTSDDAVAQEVVAEVVVETNEENIFLKK